ncbi:MAG TPA: proliferating cell nuclear antigen (pcna) [Candidatus Altiarchaeales archaeon]|nr:proliferating cell nuclear antigen (pcna) [Candidatus Altiarchaeales archaeon]
MFKAVISDTRNWKSSIDAIASILDEGTFIIDSDGMHLRAMDPSQIAMLDFNLPASSFESFELDRPIDIGIDFAEMSKITKRVKAEDKIHLSLDKRLGMTFKGDTTRSFKIAVIDAHSSPPKEPQIEFTSSAKIPPAIIKEALKDAELVSNHVALSIDDGFNIACDGDTGSVEIRLPEEKLLSLEKKSASRAVFSLDHLNNILKEAEPPSIVQVKLRTDAPLQISYSIGDSKLVYYLAPRIESM